MKFRSIKIVTACFCLVACQGDTKEQSINEIHNVCFHKRSIMERNLPAALMNALEEGSKSKIIKKAEESNFRYTLGSAALNKCQLSDDLEKLVVYIVPPNRKKYSGGTLNMLFDNDQLKAAELRLILIP